MTKLLILDYNRLLCLTPETNEEDAKKLNDFNESVGKKLSEKVNLSAWSISVPKHMQVRVIYFLNDSGNIEKLVSETAEILECSAKEAELPDNNYFKLSSSSLTPQELYMAEIQKKVIDSFLRR